MPAVSSVVMPEFERRSTDAARVRVVVLGALARQRLTAPLSLGAGLLAWPARRSRWRRPWLGCRRMAPIPCRPRRAPRRTRQRSAFRDDCAFCRRSFAPPRGVWRRGTQPRLFRTRSTGFLSAERSDAHSPPPRPRTFFLTVHRVERDDAVRNAEFFQKLLRCRNFVGFLVDFDMRQHQRRVGGEGAEYLLRPDVVEGVKTSLENLAVERQSANAGNRFVIVQLRGVIPKGLLDIFRSQPLRNETDRSVRGRF